MRLEGGSRDPHGVGMKLASRRPATAALGVFFVALVVLLGAVAAVHIYSTASTDVARGEVVSTSGSFEGGTAADQVDVSVDVDGEAVDAVVPAGEVPAPGSLVALTRDGDSWVAGSAALRFPLYTPAGVLVPVLLAIVAGAATHLIVGRRGAQEATGSEDVGPNVA